MSMRVMGSLYAVVVCASSILSGDSLNTTTSFIVREIGHPPRQIQISDNRATVVVFVSAVCPMSVDYLERLSKLDKRYSQRKVRILLVNSNENESDRQVMEQRKASGLALPIYRDTAGKLATQLEAYSTPTAIVLDQRGAMQYWGSIDDARNPDRVTRPHLQLAIDAILAGRTVDRPRTRVMGCSIKGTPAR